MTLGEYLKAAGARTRQSAVFDCCAFPADWAIECGRPDPMARWRNEYASEAEAEALVFDAGGLVALFAIGMADAGIPEAFTPMEGDIAVVSIQGEEAGAIFTGRRWAFAAARGIAAGSIERENVVRMWRP